MPSAPVCFIGCFPFCIHVFLYSKLNVPVEIKPVSNGSDVAVEKWEYEIIFIIFYFFPSVICQFNAKTKPVVEADGAFMRLIMLVF